MKTCISFVLLTMAIGLVGCDQKKDDVIVIGSADDPVIMAKADDAERKVAVDEARNTVSDFVTVLENPKPSQSSFAVKKLFTQDETREYMWLNQLSYKDGVFFGTLNNDPQLVDNVKRGEKFSVTENEIHDWMYFEDEDIVGGYTVKVLMDRLKQSQE